MTDLQRVLAAVADGLRTADQMADRTGVAVPTVRMYLSKFKEREWVVLMDARAANGSSQFEITPKGRQNLVPEAADAQRRVPLLPSDMHARCLALIAKAPNGLHSGELARRVGGCTSHEVETALAVDVVTRKLVTCAVVVAEGKFVLYKVGAGSARSASDPRIGMAPSAFVNAAPASQPTEIAKATPASTAPAPTPAPVPVDIDRVHRKHDDVVDALVANIPAGALSIETQEASGNAYERALDERVEDPGEEFLCTVYSDGTLWIQKGDGTQFDLAPDEACKLAGYLHHIRAAKLLRAIVGSAS